MGRNPTEISVLCRVPKSDLCYLRYTLESYEGLCVPTSLPGGEGRVRLLTASDRREELETALEAIAREIPLKVEKWETP